MKTCIYFNPKENQSLEEIISEVRAIKESHESECKIEKIFIETQEFIQLANLMNKEINHFECIILNQAITDEFYIILLDELSRQNGLKIKIAD